ncbi:bifunctional ADP-dependent NAD(P)H-hydrate dehydratase/NAD(P)H-hydrate epimerase [Oceanibaculum pacificum]|uniref:Bifunctional NAD(P)H-hydrate repair enzyme n=1 Tax=Oceanibaculum pacificum TaxID=580166 RepID=A0A154W8T6_9PROT|nr:bifunctional ADP-dependent NAD(P)H-hydrate dehydratase/NAD(P)H-hydrate epimerase [Oceanibaculum pacificum]KZD09873.1 bifunctional ADP-dependent (S)-NAD(P)H-hydrate dehydratase/NAD(P)H-hydrate epimerase [Oceanibaculum pacificum]
MRAGDLALLTTAEMYAADRLAMAGGVAGTTLMEAAGRAVANAILRRYGKRHALVLCGPGNNGGDGYVIARLLAAAGWPVTLAALGTPKGDAAVMARTWTGPVQPLDQIAWDGVGLVVDALFGAGLSKPMEGAPREALERAVALGLPLVAVDVPSGLSGDTGDVLGYAPKAALTVTFFRGKPGHLLLPGRDLCGDVIVSPIGIPDGLLDEIGPRCWRNAPALWLDRLPRLRPGGHKYGRGHALILGGRMTGAGRLAALAARRAGAGLLSLAVPPDTVDIYAADHPGSIVVDWPDVAALPDILRDPRRNALLIGPGLGVGEETRAAVAAVLATGRPTVLDADAISAFAGDAQGLKALIKGECLLTPHEGEFARLFDWQGDRLARARRAAAWLGATILLKGADSVIAAPDGRAAINNNAPPWLATAGTGDVLAGLALGLLAQGMPMTEAAAAACWLHGAAAQAAGPGMIAEDIAPAIPGVLARLERIRRLGA